MANIFELSENPLPQRLYNDLIERKFTDTKIIIDDKAFYVHGSILKSTSEKLRLLLSETNRNGCIEFDHEYVDPSVFNEILDFIYRAKIKITPENAKQICFASYYLGLEALPPETEELLCDEVTLENATSFYNISVSCQLDRLKNICIKEMNENHKHFMNGTHMQEFLIQDLLEFIQQLNVQYSNDSEMKENLFEFITLWVEHKKEERKMYMKELYELIPFQDISPVYINEKIRKHRLFQSSCSQFLLNCIVGKDEPTESLSSSSSSHTEQIVTPDGNHSVKPMKQKGYPNVTFSMYLYSIGAKNHKWKGPSTITRTGAQKIKWEAACEEDMLEDRKFFCAESYFENIFVVGGVVNGSKVNTIEKFDCNEKKWKKIDTTLPEPKSGCAIGRVDKRLFISGGLNQSNTATTTLYLFEPGNGRIKIDGREQMKVARNRHQLVFDPGNKCLYAIGGADTKIVEKYDPEQRKWSELSAQTNYTHGWVGATIHKDKLYVISREGFECYSFDDKPWEILEDCKIGDGTNLVSFDERLLAIGGCTKESANPTGYVYEFDTSNKTWNRLMDGEMIIRRKNHCSVLVKHKRNRTLQTKPL